MHPEAESVRAAQDQPEAVTLVLGPGAFVCKTRYDPEISERGRVWAFERQERSYSEGRRRALSTPARRIRAAGL